MAAKPVKIAFLADTKDFTSSMDKVGAAADGAAAEVKSSSDKIDSALSTAADGSDKLATASAQTAGGLGDLGGALGLLPGPLGAMGAAMETAAPAIMGVTGAADLLNVATEKFPILSKAATAATKAQAIATRVLGAALRFALGPIGLVILALTVLVGVAVLAYKKSETFQRIVNKAFSLVKAAASALKAGFIASFNGIVSAITRVINFAGTLKSKVSDGFSAIVDFIKSVPGKIRALGGFFADAGKAIIGRFVEGLKNAGGVVSDIAGNIWNAVKTLLNSAIDRINSALEFTISLPGPNITVNPPNIPHLAKGGIVYGPTLALIGEAGPEAVVPLGQGYMGGVNVYKIEVTAPVGSSSADIGRSLVKHIDAYERAGGRRRK